MPGRVSRRRNSKVATHTLPETFICIKFDVAERKAVVVTTPPLGCYIVNYHVIIGQSLLSEAEMIEILIFRDHTISALPIFLGDGCWGASYTVCRRGKFVRNSDKIPQQRSPELAQRAAISLAIQCVEERLLKTMQCGTLLGQ